MFFLFALFLAHLVEGLWNAGRFEPVAAEVGDIETSTVEMMLVEC
jgi:hypothetical protein